MNYDLASFMTKALIAVILLLAIFSTLTADAQQTVFNVPSSDVTDKNSFFFQHQSGPRPWGPKSWTMTDNLGYGIGLHTELDVTEVGLNAFGGRKWADQTTLGIGFKTVWPLLSKKYESSELKWTVGELIPTTFKNTSVGSWSYSTLSGRIPKLNTRITAGVDYGTKQIYGTHQFSTMVAYEQPLNRHWMLQGDWFSGTHTGGVFIPGIVYSFNSGTMLSFGFQIPNPGAAANKAFVFEYTTFFKQPSFRKLHQQKGPGTKWRRVPEFDFRNEAFSKPAPSADLLNMNRLSRHFYCPERFSMQISSLLDRMPVQKVDSAG